MEQIIEIMLPAFVACLILTGIHTYLGLHVVERGVIFVDLALAQIAALGSTFAFLLGFDPKSPAGYFYSLGFAFVGAAIFSFSRLKDNRVPQEALIGITFAVASSAAILIADRAPQGAEHVEEMLTGAILWIDWPTIWKTLLIYLAVGSFHVLFRKQFILISMNPKEAQRQGLAVRWWDFLFYMSFGFVITSSVAIAGVLLVFSFLIIPSVIGMLYSNRIGPRLSIGWVTGTLVSLVGLYLSYSMDFPSGPSIVCTFGLFLIAAAVLRYVSRAEQKARAAAAVGLTAAMATGMIYLAFQFRPHAVEETQTPLSAMATVRQTLKNLASQSDLDEKAVQPLLDHHETFQQALERGELEVAPSAVRRIGELGDARMLPIVSQVFAEANDPWTQFYAAEAQVHLGDKSGVHNLIRLLKDDGPVFLKNQVIAELKEIAGSDFGYDVSASESENDKAFNRAEVWWHQNTDRLAWDADKRTFRLP